MREFLPWEWPFKSFLLIILDQYFLFFGNCQGNRQIDLRSSTAAQAAHIVYRLDLNEIAAFY